MNIIFSTIPNLSESKIVCYFNELNPTGQEHATEYVENLTHVPKYQKVNDRYTKKEPTPE